jgi:hypothetical protein
MLIYTALVDQLFDFESTDDVSYERVLLNESDFLNEYTSGDKILMGKTIARARKLLFG